MGTWQRRFCKFFCKKNQKNAKLWGLGNGGAEHRTPRGEGAIGVNFSRSKIHRFTDSHICVCWKNPHNNIIILYIIYLL